MIKSKNGIKKTLILCVCGVLAFLCCAFTITNKPVKASASSEELPESAEQAASEDVTPYFGGKDKVTLKLVLPEYPNYPMFVDFEVYAENYVWPMSDRGHYDIIVYFFEYPPIDFYVDIKFKMNFMWPEGVADHRDSTITANGKNMVSGTRMKDMLYAKEHNKTASGRTFTGWSCYGLVAELTATLNGKVSATTILRPTF